MQMNFENAFFLYGVGDAYIPLKQVLKNGGKESENTPVDDRNRIAKKLFDTDGCL